MFICSRERDDVIDVCEINHIRTAEMKSNEAGVILAVVNEISAIS